MEKSVHNNTSWFVNPISISLLALVRLKQVKKSWARTGLSSIRGGGLAKASKETLEYIKTLVLSSVLESSNKKTLVERLADHLARTESG